MKTHLKCLVAVVVVSGCLLSTPALALKINLVYATSVTSNANSAQIQAAVNKAAKTYESLYSDPITVNFQVGWGESLGYPVTSLGISGCYAYGSYSLSQMKTLLSQKSSSADDQLAYSHFPVISISPANYGIACSQAKQLGLVAANATGIDGYIAFGSNYSFDFDNSDGVSSGSFDLYGVALHEISHMLGRISGLASPTPTVSLSIDLFRYRAPNTMGFSYYEPAYVSLDWGVTNLKNFNYNSDTADRDGWASDDPTDPFNAFATSGVVVKLSQADITLHDILGLKVSVPLTLSGSVTNLKADLSWTPVNGVAAYNILRSTTNSGLFTTIASNISNTAYSDAAVSDGITYYYQVTAGAMMSNMISLTPKLATAPNAPSNLSAAVVMANKKTYKANLKWSQSTSANISSNRIYRSTGGSFTLYKTLAATSTFSETVKPGITYTYYVTAVNSSGLESAASNQALAKP